MTQAGLDLIRQLYVAANLAFFAFLVTTEGGPLRLDAFPGRLRHVARNLGVFVLVVLVADGIVLAWWLGVPSMLLVSNGLLTPLALPPLAQFAIGFVAVDLADYALHRLSHRFRPLWWLHAVHHSDPHLDTSTALRFHPVEVSVQVLVSVGVLYALGIPLWVEGARAVLLNPLAMLQHANLAYPAWVERAFGWLFVTPAMHRLHHSSERRLTDSNYGVVFPFWDRLFGSWSDPSRESAGRYGLPSLDAERWQTVVGMIATPVRAPVTGAL